MTARAGRLVLRMAVRTGAAVLVLVAVSLAVDQRRHARRARARPPVTAPPPGVRCAPLPPAAAPAPDPPAPAAGPPARPLRLAGLLLAWAAVGLAVTLLVALAGSFAFGYRSMTVMSGSMEPAIHTGDVVVNRPIAPAEARVGDVVTFREPGSGSRFITHRVRRVVVRGGRVAFVTKGDANTGMERWSVSAGGEIGRVAHRLPYAGYGLFWARGPLAALVLIAIPGVLLGGLTLVRIWRPAQEAPSGVPG